MTSLIKVLQRAVQRDASDVHLKEGGPPYFRLDGQLEPQEGAPLTNEDIEQMLTKLLNEAQMKLFLKRGEIDLAFTEKGVGRFRVNAFRQRGNVAIVMRRVKTKILTFSHNYLL